MAGQTRIDGNLIDTGTDPNDIVSVSVGDGRYPRLSEDNTLAGNLTVDGDLNLVATGAGTGVFTIAAPDSNTNRTLTLPDEAGTVITSGSYVPGITEVDNFNLSTNLTGDLEPINNWEKQGSSTGVGVSVSSGGNFSFPSNGYWFYNLNYGISGTDNFVQFNFQLNGNRQGYGQGLSFFQVDGSQGGSYSNILKITDFTNDFFNIEFVNVNGLTLEGSTTDYITSILFSKLREL